MEFFIAAVLVAGLMWVGVPRRSLRPAAIAHRASKRPVAPSRRGY